MGKSYKLKNDIKKGRKICQRTNKKNYKTGDHFLASRYCMDLVDRRT